METTFIKSGIRLKQLQFLVLILLSGFFTKAIAQPDCEPIEASSCLDNITENFNTNDGGFSSSDFTWNRTDGNWQALIQNSTESFFEKTYTITSGVYTVTQEDYVNYGFVYTGVYRVDITVIDATSGAAIVTCGGVATTAFGEVRGQHMTCLTFTNEGLDIGDEIRFVTTFNPRQRGFRYGKYIIYDDFSVAGSAVPVTNSGLQLQKETSLAKYNYKRFDLFPNPVLNTATLSFDKLPGEGTLTIKRADGYLLRIYKVKKGSDSSVLDMSKERPGLYVVTIQVEGGKRMVKKLFKYN